MSIKKIKILLLISLLFYSCNIQKKKSTAKVLNQFTNNLGHFGFQGNILAANDDKVTINKFIGYQNSETRTQLYPIASITKSFTSVSILLLKQQGKLQLSDTISNYFNDVPKDKSTITIHQLLTHASGLQRDVRNLTNENFTKEIFKSLLKYKIGEKFSYSNAGYMLLGKVIEIISKTSFEDFVKENIFKPCKMNNSFFEKDSIYWKNIPETQNEYGAFKVFNKNYKPFGIGNTGIVSNAEDLNKWFHTLLKEKLLNKQNVKELFTPHIKINHPIQDSYGYGFYFRINSIGDTLISHGGDIFGYHSEFTFNKNKNNTTIVLTNTERYNVGIHKRSITKDIHKIIENQPVEISKISINDNINTKEFLGNYRLDSINEFEIYAKENKLKLGIKGQHAINLFKVKTKEQLKYVRNKNSLTNKIINAINKKDTLALKQYLHSDDYSFFANDWIDEFANYRKKYGSLNKFTILGSIAYPWQKKFIKTFVNLEFENQSLNYDFVWNKNRLNETISEEDYIYPLNYFIAIDNKKQIIVYDLVTSNVVKIIPNKESLRINSEQRESKFLLNKK